MFLLVLLTYRWLILLLCFICSHILLKTSSGRGLAIVKSKEDCTLGDSVIRGDVAVSPHIKFSSTKDADSCIIERVGSKIIICRA
jgi:hypothetical protein